uniref:Melanocortin 2 receptor accessory protein n=1 Tax=Cavia porcellus TaxID=10141 RepID=A0A286Y511_CAVPO
MNTTNTSTPYYSYEYYLDYLDFLPVDEKKLKVHKHSIAIAFWVSLAAFVMLLFLILLCMSRSGASHVRPSPQRPGSPRSPGLGLPLCFRRASKRTVEEPASGPGGDPRP